MARKNIFEQMSTKWDLEVEARRIRRLFETEKILHVRADFLDCDNYSLKDFVEEYCFSTWKARGRCINVADFLSEFFYENLLYRAKKECESFLTLIEIVFNFWKLAERQLGSRSEFKCSPNFYHLKDVLHSYLSHYNHTTIYNEETEKLIVIEDKPEATAVAEIVAPELAMNLLRYNHHTLRGDVEEKRKILNLMGQALEPKRKELKNISSRSEDNIFYFLNNLHIRHNDSDEKHIADMPESELEEWYDELYQMILFANLELDQVERNRRFKELKNLIETP